MTFQFSRRNLPPSERRLERFFEILPGAISWGVLLGVLLLAFWQPILAAMAILIFDLYWLFKLFYLTIFLVVSFVRLSIERQMDWMDRLRDLDQTGRGERLVPQEAGPRPIKARLAAWMHRRILRSVARAGMAPPRSSLIHHVIIIPVANERRAILEAGLSSLARQRFPANRMLILLAVEERASSEVKADTETVASAYRDQFLDLLLIVHPDGLPGEARVKGANAAYAAKAAGRYLAARHIPFEHVVVSCFDADTIVGPEYVACLTYRFLTTPDRLQASFQPIPVYHNNIWEAPSFARILDVGSSLFQLIEATNPEQLVTFSSHSMSFKALVDIGYWPVDLISDDSAIFWKAFIHYDGRYRVVPLYVTVSMDIAAADSWRQTLIDVYKQKRRWAWGVENFPIVMRAFLRTRTIPLWTRLRHLTKLLGGHVAWATWAFLLTVLGWLPAFMVGREFSDSVVYYSAPRITTMIFQLSSLAFFVTVLMGFWLLPPEKMDRPFRHKLWLLLEWLTIPLVTTCLGALPALDAQTRLLRGRYLEFWVAEKRRPIRSSVLSESRKSRMMDA